MIALSIKRIKTMLTKEQTRILETVFILMLPALLTKILGQGFNLVLASFYGIDDSRLNQFFIASAIPELLTSVLMVGAVGTVIIPVLLSAKEEEGEEAFYKLYSYILNASVGLFTIVSIILLLFADHFIPAAFQLTGAETLSTPAELNNIANMMRALIFPQLILGISVFIASGLNVYNRFLLPQLSPLFYNIGRLIAVFALLPLMDKSPWALVIAVYIGAFFHLIIPLPLFFNLKFKYYPFIDFRDKYLQEMLKLGLPRLFVLASDQIGLLVNSFIAAAFVGGPAALTYAKSIYLIIPTLFGYTFTYASYPTISKYFIKKQYDKIRTLVSSTLNQIVFLALPFIVIIMVLRVPLVRLFFGVLPGTQLTLVGTYQVAWILLFFTFGLIFITSRWFLFSLYYAAKDTITPSIISMFSLIGVITLSVLFTNFLSHTPNFALSSIEWNFANFFTRSDPVYRAGIGGISLAMSVTYTIEFIVLLIIFHRRKLSLNMTSLMSDFFKKGVAGLVMFVFMYFTYKIWVPLGVALPESAAITGYTGSTTLNLLLLTTITVVPGFILYILICYLFKVKELAMFRFMLNPIFKASGLKRL